MMLSAHTSMRVGGPAGAFFEPESEDGLIGLVRGFEASGQPYFLLGNGTNVVVRDGGYRGAVVSTVKALGRSAQSPFKAHGSKGVQIPNVIMKGGVSSVVCGAGESLARVCRAAAERGLSGMEALSGIPGTVGGAIYMNAGAYGSEIADLVVAVRAYDRITENCIMLSLNECGFGYRVSVFKARDMVILSAELALRPGNREEIEAKMADYTRRRNEKQPVELPSAGSFFKRPEGDFAGRLIEAAGLKGLRVGGAQVSEKHAGFIVNAGGATASDVLALADMVKARVFEASGVRLEEEPVVIGVDV